VIARWAGMAFATALAFLAPAPAAALAPARPAIAGEIPEAQLPREARQTLALIRSGGPFPYAKDGATFSNREGALPRHHRGYYREYTVKTPHVRNRGTRRIIWGAGGEFYYTDDHYNRFWRIRE
jgi:ribonuclease T1